MKNYAERVCLACGVTYAPTNAPQKYCVKCGAEIDCENRRKAVVRFELSHPHRHRAWCIENAEKVRMTSKAWDLANPGRKRATTRAWEITHPVQNRIIIKRKHAKRRTLGFVPMNQPFIGCEGHHINDHDVIYIPEALHKSIAHNVWTGRNMEEINAKACAWLTEDWA